MTSFSLFSSSPSLTGSESRLITSRIHCADSRGLGDDGFTDPEPRTGFEPNSTVDNKIVTEQEIERATSLKRVRFQKLRISSLYPITSHCSLRLKILLKSLLCLKKQTWTTNKFVLCWVHHGICRNVKQCGTIASLSL